MGRYILKRLLMVIPILIGVTLFIFLTLSLTPGDPAKLAMGNDATEEQLQAFREQNGLDKSLPVQYLTYMGKAITGDFGKSFITRQTVTSMIGARIGNTLFLSFTSIAFTIIVSLIMGVTMAVKQNSLYDNTMRVVTIILTSMPQFWLAIMMILLFAVKLRWLPSSGLGTFKQAIIPIICCACSGITMCTRTTRASMLEVINQDYIRTARAKGLRSNDIIWRHALKNALLPMITVYGRMVASCFNGSVVIESIFGINGIGTMMMNALRQKDIPAIMGGIIISACVITVVNLLTDLAYAFVDPRIRSHYRRATGKKKTVRNTPKEGAVTA